MFTGIVQGIAEIISIKKNNFFLTYTIKLPDNMLINLQIGASLSNNGCCLTISKINKNLVSFDIIQKTLSITNLSKLKVGDKINVERALNFTNEVGGHLMSGHIITTAKICKIFHLDNKICAMCFILKDSNLMKFIFNKGFIGIDGISLTISKVYKNKFFVNLIPHTLLLTTIGLKKIGEFVNIEIDLQTQIIVQCTERFLKNQKNIILKDKIYD